MIYFIRYLSQFIIIAILIFSFFIFSCNTRTHIVSGEAEIFTGTQPPYKIDAFSTGGEYFKERKVHLKNNDNSINPTWEKLMAFLRRDDTDKKLYWTLNLCSNYAECLHNNAEMNKIKAAFVVINFRDQKIGHALNAFETIDKGIVFIDCTGIDTDEYVSSGIMEQAGYISLLPAPIYYDKVAYIEIGKEYGLISINNTDTNDYQYYTKWKESYNECLITLKDIPNIIFEGSKYDITLREISPELHKLGPYWESLGIVSHVKIYW